jgi:hypothetical protein
MHARQTRLRGKCSGHAQTRERKVLRKLSEDPEEASSATFFPNGSFFSELRVTWAPTLYGQDARAQKSSIGMPTAAGISSALL